eukprot:scaffold40490_cov63-Phaeocystis_antarctica.AAC.2
MRWRTPSSMPSSPKSSRYSVSSVVLTVTGSRSISPRPPPAARPCSGGGPPPAGRGPEQENCSRGLPSWVRSLSAEGRRKTQSRLCRQRIR